MFGRFILLIAFPAMLFSAAPELISRDGGGVVGVGDSGFRLSLGVPIRSPLSNNGDVWFVSQAPLSVVDVNGVSDLYRNGGVYADLGTGFKGNLEVFGVTSNGGRLWLGRPSSSFFPDAVTFTLLEGAAPVTLLTGVDRPTVAELAKGGSFAVWSAPDGSNVSQVYWQDIDGSPGTPLLVTAGYTRTSIVGGISDDGDAVVFETDNFDFPGIADTNGVRDVMLYRAGTGTFARISQRVNLDGPRAARNPHISGDGQVVVFESRDGGLTADDGDALRDLFVWHGSGLVRIAAGSTDTGNEASTGNHLNPRLNQDGRFIVFRSNGALSDAGSNGFYQIYCYDRADGSVALLSATEGGAAANGNCFMPELSPSGRWVSFVTQATNLSADATGSFRQVYRVDRGSRFLNRRPSATATLISTAANVAAAFTPAGMDPDGDPIGWRVTALPASGELRDGAGELIVANQYYGPETLPWSFTGTVSTSFTVVADDGISQSAAAVVQVRIVDPVNGTTVPLSHLAAGVGAEASPVDAQGISISGDGSRAVYTARISSNAKVHVYYRDLIGGVTRQLSTDAISPADNCVISADGQVVYWFATTGSNTITLKRLALATDALSGPTSTWAVPSSRPSVSGDGRFILFAAAGNLHLWDAASTSEPVDLGAGSSPAMSEDGNFIAWQRAGAGGSEVVVKRRSDSQQVLVIEGSQQSQSLSLSRHGRFLLYRDSADAWQRRDLIAGTTLAAVAVADTARLSASGRFIIYSTGGAAGVLYRLDLNGAPAAPTVVGNIGTSIRAAISATGSIVAFSTPDDLLAGLDTNGVRDVYLRDFGSPAGTAPAAQLTTIAATEDQLFTASPAIAMDADNEDLSIELTVEPQHATQFSFQPPSPLLPAGLLTYQAAADYNGSDSFTYRFREALGPWREQSVAIGVAAVNDPPVLSATGDLAIDENATLVRTLTVIDVDAGDAVQAFRVDSGPGEIINGEWRYTPDYAVADNANPTVTLAVTLTAVDTGGAEGSTNFSITVTNTDRLPVVSSAGISPASPLTTDDLVLAVTAVDPDGDAVSVAVSWYRDGDLQTEWANQLTVPAAATAKHQHWTANIVATANGFSSPPTATSVDIGNTSPIPVSSELACMEDSTVDFQLSATDADGDTVSFTLVTPPAHGHVSGISPHLMTYTPAADYFGADSFSWLVSDGDGLPVPGSTTVTIAAVPDAPVISVKRLILFAGQAAGVTDERILHISDPDYPDGLPSTGFTLLLGPLSGGILTDRNSQVVTDTVAVADLPLTFTPDAARLASASIVLQVRDDTDRLSAPATLEIVTGATPMALRLHRGWNAVCFPQTPLPEALTAVAAAGRGKLYRMGPRRLAVLDPAADAIAAGVGLWVYADAEITLNDLPADGGAVAPVLVPGWNFVGPIGDTVQGLPAGVTHAWRYDDRGRLLQATELPPGTACWLYYSP